MPYSSHYYRYCFGCQRGKYQSSSRQTSCRTCPAGYRCPGPSSSQSSSRGAWTYYSCPGGYYAPSGSYSCRAVGRGYWAPARSSTRYACPTGRYSSSTVASSSSCSGCCSAGYYCPSGSSSATQTACGASSLYCPSCTTSKRGIPSGYYGTGGGSTTRTGYTSCPAGSYCASGVRNSCPAGRYGSAVRLTSSSCSGACQAGYYCPTGSASSTQKKCGDSHSTCAAYPSYCYCPTGTSSVKFAADGYYTVPVQGDWKTRTGVVRCGSSDVCRKGIKVPPIAWTTTGCRSDGTADRTIGEDKTGEAGGGAVDAALSTGYSDGGISYYLLKTVPTPGCKLSSPFSVNKDTGKIVVNSGIDYETCPQYVLTTQARWSKASTTADHISCTVTVKVQDANEKPSITRCSNLNVDEGVPLDTAVGAPLQATDPDRAQSLEWSFSSTGHPFTIQKCSGQVFTSSTVNYNTKSSYTLGVVLKDDGTPTLQDTCTITITVNKVPRPPVIRDASCTIAENSPLNAIICKVDASDPDGDTLTYSVARRDDPDAIGVNSKGEIIVKEAVLDFETKRQYSIDVAVSDGVSSAKGTVVVTLTDANDPPVMPSGEITRTVKEGAAAGTKLGAVVTGTDPDAGDTLTYSVASSDFDMDSSGQLKVSSTANIDYETTKQYELTIVATDSQGSTASAKVTVNVVDVNEKPSFGTITSLSVNENTEVNGAVGSPIPSSDPDGGQTLFYSITSGNSAGHFSIDALTGQVKVGKLLDYETTKSYTLGLKVEDNGSPKLSDTGSVTINVNDVQEGPTFSQASTSKSFAEHSADGTTVVDLGSLASDPEGDAMTFTINSGNTNDVFAISGTKLVVASGKSASLDYETTPNTYDLEVTVTDGTDKSGMSANGRVKISLTDVQEPPVFVLPADASPGDPLVRGVQENAPVGTKIGSPLTARDPDAADTLTYSIKTNDASNNFAIDKNTGQLSAAKKLPGASSTTIGITVSVTDGTATVDIGVQIGLINTNDPPTITGSTQNVREDATVGTVLTNAVAASDPDGHTLSYQLVSGAFGSFALDTGTGKITVAGKLDFETRATYSLVVAVVDQPDGDILPLTASATVTVKIIDVNEPPKVTVPGIFSVDENADSGTAVGTKLEVTDEDAGESFTFSIVGGDDKGAFSVDDKGQIKVAKPSELNFEAKPSYALDVQVEDGGKNKVKTTVRINLVDTNDAPKLVIVDQNITVPENTAVGTKISTLQATDEDESDTMVFGIVDEGDGTFDVVQSSGAIMLDKPLNYEVTKEYTLSVFVKDAGLLRSSGAVRVIVADSPDPPKYAGPDSVSIDEHSAKGTVVFTARATDEDADETFTYSITEGNDDGVFEIESRSGKVKVREPLRLNYETTSKHTLTIQVSDKDDLTASGKTVVNVNDVNEAPSLTTKALTVAEADSVDGKGSPFYSLVGSPVGTGPVTFVDEDFNQNHSVRILSGNSHGLFAFGPYVAPSDVAAGTASWPVSESTDATQWVDQGFQLYVRNASVLDFEGVLNKDGRTTVKLEVEIRDNGSPALSSKSVIAVDIEDRNERPTIERGAVRKVDENSAVNALVGTLPIHASDPDSGDILAFRIESGDPDGLFKIDPCGGQIKVAREGLDFETRSRYDLVVSVTDDGSDMPGPASLSDRADVTIIILDVNEPPTLYPATRELPENKVAPFTFGSPLTVVDEDFAQTHVFTITREDSNAKDLFEIDSATGVLQVKTTEWGRQKGLDYEWDNSFSITVRATDNGTRPANLWSEAEIAVRLTDVNEPPIVEAGQVLSVPENTAAGTVLKKAVQGADYDAGSVISFSIVQDGSLGARLFRIDETTGRVSIAPTTGNSTTHPELDYEMRNSTWFTVRVNDTELYTDAVVTVAITDVNEAPMLHAGSFRVNETAIGGTALEGSPVTSSDVDHDQQVTYRITKSTPTSAFTIDAISGEVSVMATATLDFETTPQYTLTIVGTDSGIPRLSAEATYTVTVIDQPERPEMDDSTGIIPENTAVGTLVTNMSASDVDEGDVLTFSLTGSAPPGVADRFTIDPMTGGILVTEGAGSINHETLPDHKISLEVTVTDSFGLTAVAYCVVSVTDVPEAPVFSPPNITYKAARTAGTVGEALTSYVMDEDVSDAHVFDYVSTTDLETGTVGEVGFELDAFGTLSIPEANANSAAFQSGKRYAIALNVVDSAQLSDSGTLTIEFTENNIAPELLPAEVSIDENPTSDLVTILQADDVNKADAELAQDVTYTIRPVGQSVNRPFPFNISTVPRADTTTVSAGRVFITDASLVDYEKEQVFYAAVVVRDNAKQPLETQAILTIRINDVQEAPVFASSTVTASVPENSPAGTQVGLPISATDEDAADFGKLVYSWTDAGADAVFSLDSATGVVTIADGAAIDFETRSEYSFGVRVTDTAGLSDVTSLIVSVIDVNEQPTFSAPSAVEISEASRINDVVGTMSASDQDGGSWGVLSFFLQDDDGANGAFRVDSESGKIIVDKVVSDGDEHIRLLDFEDRVTYNLAVGVRDAGGLSRTGTVKVTLTDANDLEIVGFTIKSDASGRASEPEGSMADQGDLFDPWASISDRNRLDIVSPTEGGVEVWLHGRGLGSTSAKLARDFPGQSSSDVHQLRVQAVSLVNSNNTISVSCTLYNDTTALCTMPEGAGAGWTWEVEVLGSAQAFTRKTHPLGTVKRPITGYVPPSITAIYRQAFVDGTTSSFMATVGGETFTLEGTDLGNPALGFSQVVSYGPVSELWDSKWGVRRTPAVDCRSIGTSQTKIECKTHAGLGAKLDFKITVEGQSSPDFAPDAATTGVRYAAPSISAIELIDGTSPAMFDTSGGNKFVVSGSNFGPEGAPGMRIWYGEAGFSLPATATPFSPANEPAQDDRLRFEAASCRVVGSSHNRVECVSTDGVGANLVAAAAIRGLASGVPSSSSSGSPTLSYKAPVIQSADGPGWRLSPTKGGVAFSLVGEQFGPAGLVVPVVQYGPRSGDKSKYTAVDCAVTGAHTVITCNTDEGTGTNHVVRIWVRGQAAGFNGNVETVAADPIAYELGTNMSMVTREVGLAYAPPVVTRYSGKGAVDGDTVGMESVAIEGLDFGPVSDGIELVTYGLDNSTEYIATSCVMTRAHQEITCQTAEGAGAGLRWVVWIDGQRSRAPTTDYHEPVITGVDHYVSGEDWTDGWTDGGQMVSIKGWFFGPSSPSYLEDVTYGRTGKEYVAEGCKVLDHTEVRCRSVAGTGRGLRWRMSVRGQDSGLTDFYTSYNDPEIHAASPATGTTEGVEVRFTGFDFGIRDKRLGEEFTFVQPSTTVTDPDTGVSKQVITGLPGAVPCTDRICLLWNDEYFLAVENPQSWTGVGNRTASAHQVRVQIPEGAGTGIPMQLVLKTGPGKEEDFGIAVSNRMTWDYLPPVIEYNVGKERVRDRTLGVVVKLTIQGSHFSSDPLVYAFADEATYTANSASPSALEPYLLSHCTAIVPHRHLECLQFLEQGTIVISAGGQHSVITEKSRFKKATPTIGNLQGAEWDELRLPTAGGYRLEFEVHSIVPEDFRVTIEDRDCEPIPGTPLVGEGFFKPTSPPYEGAPAYTYDEVQNRYHTVTCLTPEGAGVDQRLFIGDGQSDAPQMVRFASPAITSWRAIVDDSSSSPATLDEGKPRTSGGLIEINGGNFSSGCPLPESGGGAAPLECTESFISLFSEGVEGPIPKETAFTVQSWSHGRIVVSIAEGEGKDFLLGVTAYGLAGFANFDYAPPAIDTHTSVGPTAGGVDMTLSGANFGVSPPTVTLRRPAGSAIRFDGSAWSASDVVVTCPYVSHTHTSLTCTLPSGQGRFWHVEIDVAGQHGTRAYNLDASTGLPIDGFAYERPAVSVIGPLEGATAGGYLSLLTGTNLGTSEAEIEVRVGPSVREATPDWDEQDWESAVARPMSSEATISAAAAGWITLHPSTRQAQSATISAALADPAAAVAALPAESWRQALLAQGDGEDPLPAEEAPENGLAVAAILAQTDGSHSHNGIAFRFPEGQGSALEVRVRVAGQTSDPVTFAYERPNITNIEYPSEINTEGSWPADDAKASDRQVMTIHGTSFGINATQRTKVLLFRPAAEYDENGERIAGGDSAERRSLQQSSMVASGFSPSAAEVSDAIECDTAVQKMSGLWMSADSRVYSHTLIQCPVPRGWGRELRLVTKVMERYSTPISFSYDPAEVDYFTPNTPSALGTHIMSIYGKNFGPEPTPLDIRIGGVPCNGSSWVRDSSNQGRPYLKCIVSEDNAGVRNMTIFVAGQEAEPVVADGRLRLICPYNWYGIEEPCLPCPIGGICKGDLAWPYAEPGFWDLKPNNTLQANDPYRKNCPAERLNPSRRTYCSYIVACKPKEACSGNNTCTYGYEGIRCKDCLKGKFYRRAGECVKCPDLPLVQLLAFVVAVIAAGCGAYAFQRYNIHLASIQIAIDYFQVLAMIARAKVPWPPLIKEILLILSAFNLNLELAAPECLFPELGYPLKWGAVAALPVCAFILFGLLHVFVVVKKICMGRDRKKLCAHSPSFAGSMLMLGFYAYMVETRNSLDVFNCSPTVPDDGFTYLESVIERCGEPGGVQELLAPFAGLALLIYSIGYPAILGYLLYTRRDKVRQDQVLRVFGIGDSRLTNPNSYVLRKYLSKLYQHFRPEFFYWVLAILLRKAGISVVALMFRENPAYQLSCALLVVFCSYAAQVRFIPYMPPSTYEAELSKHQRLVTEGHPLHNAIANAIAPAIAHMRHQKRQRARAMWGMDAPSLRSVAVTNFFDYNTTEAILLGCAVFTCLAGIMFQSGALDGSNRPEVVAQRETVTWVLTAVLILSILYVLAVVANEAYAQCNRGKAAGGKKGGKKGGRKGSKTAAAGGKAGGKGDADLLADGDIVASSAHTDSGNSVTSDSAQLNPMFMSGDGGAGGIASSAAHIVGSDSAPDTAAWQVVRTEFTAMQEELSDLKRQLETQSAGGSGGVTTRTAKQRFTHSPMRAATATTPEERLGMSTDAPGANPLFKSKGSKASRRNASRRQLLAKKGPSSPTSTGLSVGAAASGATHSNPMARGSGSKASFGPTKAE